MWVVIAFKLELWLGLLGLLVVPIVWFVFSAWVLCWRAHLWWVCLIMCIFTGVGCVFYYFSFLRLCFCLRFCFELAWWVVLGTLGLRVFVLLFGVFSCLVLGGFGMGFIFILAWFFHCFVFTWLLFGGV